MQKMNSSKELYYENVKKREEIKFVTKNKEIYEMILIFQKLRFSLHSMTIYMETHVANPSYMG